MTWLIPAVVGLIAGLSIAWLLDYLFWRDRRICSDYEKELETSLGTLQTENASLSADVNALNARVVRVGELESALASSKADFGRLKVDYDAQAGQIDKLNADLSASRSEIGSLKASTNQIGELDIKLKERDTAIADLKTKFEARGAEISGLNARLSDKDSEISTLRGQLEEVDVELGKLGLAAAGGAAAGGLFAGIRGRLGSLRGQMSESVDVSADVEGLNVELGQLRTDLSARDAEITRLKAELSAATAVEPVDTSIFESEIAQLRSDLSAREAEISRLGAELSAAAAVEPVDTSAFDSEIAQLRADLAGRDARLADLTSSLESKELELGDLRTVVDGGASEAAALQTALNDKEAELAQLRLDFDARGTELSGLKGKYADIDVDALQRELGANADEITRLKSELNLSKLRLADLEQDLEPTLMVEDDAEVMRLQLEARDMELGKLRTTLAEREGELGELRAEFDDGDGKWKMLGLASTGAVGGGMLARLRALREDIASKNSDIADRDGEIERLRAQIAAAQTPRKPDDLTKVHGIGPKIASLLVENGVRTFRQLSQTEGAFVDQILDEHGSTFTLATPEIRASWQSQAAAAADGNWDKLESIVEQLKRELD